MEGWKHTCCATCCEVSPGRLCRSDLHAYKTLGIMCHSVSTTQPERLRAPDRLLHLPRLTQSNTSSSGSSSSGSSSSSSSSTSSSSCTATCQCHIVVLPLVVPTPVTPLYPFNSPSVSFTFCSSV